jgi:hypothetical protein
MPRWTVPMPSRVRMERSPSAAPEAGVATVGVVSEDAVGDADLAVGAVACGVGEVTDGAAPDGVDAEPVPAVAPHPASATGSRAAATTNRRARPGRWCLADGVVVADMCGLLCRRSGSHAMAGDLAIYS